MTEQFEYVFHVPSEDHYYRVQASGPNHAWHRIRDEVPYEDRHDGQPAFCEGVVSETTLADDASVTDLTDNE